MKRPGKRALRRLAAILAVPVGLWAALVLLLPMGWARRSVVAALRRSTGHEVGLDSVRLRPFGGVELRGLTLSAPKSPIGPWLKVDSLAIDLNVRDLMLGRVEPTAGYASGVAVRIHRDASGRLELADLLAREPESASRPSDDEAEASQRELALTIDDAAVTVVDEPTGARLDFSGVQGHATLSDSALTLSDLSGRLNGGTFDGAARVDRGGRRLVEAELQVAGSALGVGTDLIALIVPLLATSGPETHARGTVDLDVRLSARAESADVFARTLAGRGLVRIDGIALDDSRVIGAIRDHLPIPTHGKLGSLSGHFTIAHRRVTTTDTVLKVAEVPVGLAGWSDFDGQIQYRVRTRELGQAVAKLAGHLPPEARELLADLRTDGLDDLAELRVVGTIDHPRVTAESAIVPGASAKGRAASEKARLRAIGRRLLDKVIR